MQVHIKLPVSRCERLLMIKCTLNNSTYSKKKIKIKKYIYTLHMHISTLWSIGGHFLSMKQLLPIHISLQNYS